MLSGVTVLKFEFLQNISQFLISMELNFLLHPPATTASSTTTHTPSGQRNRGSWASQPQKSVTLLPCPGGRTTKSTKGHVVALEKKYIYIYIFLITVNESYVACLCGFLIFVAHYGENMDVLALQQSSPYNATRSTTIVVTLGPIYL